MLSMLGVIVLSAACGGPAKSATVQRISDLSYVSDGLDAHRLDLYLPEDRNETPLVVFVHGGAFMYGDRRENVSVGEALAREGIATAVVSYRLFPKTDALGSTADVAQAVAWVVKHATDYGLTGSAIFLAGHSAGGQIVALLATHPNFLRDAGVAPDVIRGVVAAAGAYDVRDLSDEPDSWQRVDGHIYGETPDARGAVSPGVNIDSTSPPTIIYCGSNDDPDACKRATYFAEKLHAAGVSATVIKAIGADHMGLLRALIAAGDPLNDSLLDFIVKHSQGDKTS